MFSDVGLGACEVDPVGLGSGLKGLGLEGSCGISLGLSPAICSSGPNDLRLQTNTPLKKKPTEMIGLYSQGPSNTQNYIFIQIFVISTFTTFRGYLIFLNSLYFIKG